MTWLVDTNIISEVRKGPRCHPGVAAWWAAVEDRDLFLSVMTLGEIRRGIEAIRHRDPAKAGALERWLRDVSDAFGSRIIGVDPAVAEARVHRRVVLHPFDHWSILGRLGRNVAERRARHAQ